MAEKNLLIDGLELHYEGLFDVNELLKAIDRYCADRGYSKSEKRRTQKVTASGRELSMEMRPTKVKTEYQTFRIKIRLHITNITDVEVLRGKAKTKLNKGDVTMIFDAWSITDYKGRWENKPVYYAFRKMIDKFVYNFLDKMTGEVVGDTHYIYKNVKAFLELHKYQ